MYNSSVIFRRIYNASYSMQIQENVMTKSQVKNEVNKYPSKPSQKGNFGDHCQCCFSTFLMGFTSDRGDRVQIRKELLIGILNMFQEKIMGITRYLYGSFHRREIQSVAFSSD